MKVPMKIVLLALAALGFLFSAGASMGQAAGSATGIEGVWAGVLGGQLHLVVTITKSSSGELGGSMNSVDQHAVLALSNITLQGSALRFEVPRVGGVYEGKLKKDGRDISGSWTQTGVPAQALDFTRRAESNETVRRNCGASRGAEVRAHPEALASGFRYRNSHCPDGVQGGWEVASGV